MDKLYRVAKEIESRGMAARVFEKADQAADQLIKEIPKEAVVAFGGSVTLQEMGLYEKLKEQGNPVIWHWKVTAEEVAETRRQALLADVFITSSNAIIEDGRLLNIDGAGNRVAAMVFGPKRVIVIAGKNKLAPDYDRALARIKEIACPKNAERLGRDLPCRLTGKCADCRSPLRMCQCSFMIEHAITGQILEVWLINEELGY
jgi:L-lactate utilization protein LutB